jgi:hypothetical protein
MSAEHFAALVCAWLASYFIHSTLMLGGVWIGAKRLPPRFDRIAEWMWRVALVLPIVSSLAQQFFSPGVGSGPAFVGAIGYTPAPLTTSRVPSAWWISFAAIWVVGAAIGLAQLYWCHRTLRRQVERRMPIPRERRDFLAGIAGAIPVTVVDELSIPFALNREICLPEWAIDRLSADELRAVVAHEVAHVRRRDAFWLTATSAIRRGFFFQPLNWLAVKKLRELSECICDDEALAATESPLPLATALERVATRAHRRRAHLALAPAMGAPISLTLRRVQRILAQPHLARSRLAVGRLPLAASTLVAALLAIFFAPRVTLPSVAFFRYTITAEDPAGPFTVTLEKGRVVDATIGGRQLARRQVRQDGERLELVDHAAVLSLRLTPEGGISWNPRKQTAPDQ